MGPNFVLDKGFKVTTATAVTKFRAVKLASVDVCAQCTTLGEIPLGVAQEDCPAADATAGRVIDIRVIGISRVIAAGALAINTRVRVDANGRVVALAAATANQNQLGILLAAATALDDQVDCLLTIGGQAGVT
jgi:hypothetical protein